MGRTREEHLNWCKHRALKYLPRDPAQAVVSMASDMNKHEETRCDPALTMLGVMEIKHGAASVKRWIEDFN